jgi:glucosamine-phosphate N-acetyltransferase
VAKAIRLHRIYRRFESSLDYWRQTLDNYFIRRLYGTDLTVSKEGTGRVQKNSAFSAPSSPAYPGFLETLSALSNVGSLSIEELTSIFRKRLKIGVETYVGIDIIEKRIISTGSIFFEQKFIHTGGIAAFIEDVAVHKEFQGKGYGRTIVEKLVNRAKEVNAYKIILACGDDKVAFYEKFGFYHNCVNMRLDLVNTKDYS